MKRFFMAAVAALGVLTAPALVQAQDFPSQPIRFIVPYSPGGSSDLLARVVAQRMSADLGQPVTVENATGAGGRVGMKLIADAEPDGYTVGLAALGATAIAAAIDPNLAYDPIEDFSFISSLATYGSFLLAHPDMPFDDLPGMIAYAKANPGKLSYGSAGVGSSSHFLGVMLTEAADVDIVHIPYGGGGGGVQDILGGHIPLHILSIAGSEAYVRDKQLKALAIFGDTRYAPFADVAPTADTLPSLVPPLTWFGMVAPDGVAEDRINRLNEAAMKALNSPELQAEIANWGLEILGGTPDELRDMIAGDIASLKSVVEQTGMMNAQ